MKDPFSDPRFIDLTGRRFGRVVVIRFDGRDRSSNRKWIVRCDCGKEFSAHAPALHRLKDYKCLKCSYVERGRKRVKHGAFTGKDEALLRTHKSWSGAKSRCTPKSKFADRYWARGIRMCSGWISDFSEFLKDMGVCPPDRSIDRINNNGHYSCGHCAECAENGWPMNCRWATDREQNNNKRNNIYLTVGGITKSLFEWSVETGINRRTLHTRLSAGWHDYDVVMTPVAPVGRRVKHVPHRDTSNIHTPLLRQRTQPSSAP